MTSIPFYRQNKKQEEVAEWVAVAREPEWTATAKTPLSKTRDVVVGSAKGLKDVVVGLLTAPIEIWKHASELSVEQYNDPLVRGWILSETGKDIWEQPPPKKTEAQLKEESKRLALSPLLAVMGAIDAPNREDLDLEEKAQAIATGFGTAALMGLPYARGARTSGTGGARPSGGAAPTTEPGPAGPAPTSLPPSQRLLAPPPRQLTAGETPARAQAPQRPLTVLEQAKADFDAGRITNVEFARRVSQELARAEGRATEAPRAAAPPPVAPESPLARTEAPRPSGTAEAVQRAQRTPDVQAPTAGVPPVPPPITPPAPSGRTVSLQVDGQTKTATLTPEQTQLWDAELERHNNALTRLKGEGARRSEGFRHAAEKRKISGLLSQAEQRKAAASAQKLVPHTPVIVNLDTGPAEGTIASRPVYGTVAVELPDGSSVRVPTERVRVREATEPTAPPPPVVEQATAPAPTVEAPTAPQDAPSIAPEQARAQQILDAFTAKIGDKARKVIEQARELVGPEEWTRQAALAVKDVTEPNRVIPEIIGAAHRIVDKLAPPPEVDLEAQLKESLAQGQKPVKTVESTLTPNIESLEDAWSGGVGDLGNPEAAHAIQTQSGYPEYIEAVRRAFVKEHGESPVLYRGMRADRANDFLERIRLQDPDGQPRGWTTRPEVAEKWRNLAIINETPENWRVVRATLASPEGIVMRGKVEEGEVVIDESYLTDVELVGGGEGPAPAAAAPVEPSPTAAPSGPPPATTPAPEAAPRPLTRQEQLTAEFDRIDDAFSSGQMGTVEYANYLASLAGKMQAEGIPSLRDAPRMKLPDTIGKRLGELTPDDIRRTRKSIASLLRMPGVMESPYGPILQTELARLTAADDAWERIITASDEAGFLRFGRRKPVRDPNRTEAKKYFDKVAPLDPKWINPLTWSDITGLGSQFAVWVYQGTAWPGHAGFKAAKLSAKVTGRPVDLLDNPGALLNTLDRTVVQALTFLGGRLPYPSSFVGPALRTPDRMRYELTGTKNLTEIVTDPELAAGDVEGFGQMITAVSTIEASTVYAARNGGSLEGFNGPDVGMAYRFVTEATPNMKAAVNEFRKLMVDLGTWQAIEGGFVPYEEARAYGEQFAKGPFSILFGDTPVIDQISMYLFESRDVSPHRTALPLRRIYNKIFDKKLGGAEFQNGLPGVIDLIYRTTRSAGTNAIAVAFEDLAAASPEAFKGLWEPVSVQEAQVYKKQFDATRRAINLVYDRHGIEIPQHYADIIAGTMGDNALGIHEGIVRFYKDGKIQWRRVSPEIAQMIKSATPLQLGWFLRTFIINPQKAIAAFTRLGIVMHPAFQIQMKAIDQFQGWANTRTGWRPVVDEAMGYRAIVKRTPEHQQMMLAGGVVPARYYGPTVTAEDIVKSQEVTVSNLGRRIRQMAEPFYEAGRMAEAIRRYRGGASAFESIFHGREFLGNYSVEGAFPAIRILNQLSLFSRPAIGVTNKTIRTAANIGTTGGAGTTGGGGPGTSKRWFGVGASLMAVALGLYAINKDDEEINRRRREPGGFRWLYFRLKPGGPVLQMRKPFGEGVLFMTMIETFLDEMRDSENTQFWNEVLTALKEEMIVWLYPAALQTAWELATNEKLSFGGSVVSEYELRKSREFQHGRGVGITEERLGRFTSRYGISIPVLSYIIQRHGGITGETIIRSLDAAINYSEYEELPMLQDAPFMERLATHWPRLSSRPMPEYWELHANINRFSNDLRSIVADAELDPSSDTDDRNSLENRLDRFNKDHENLIIELPTFLRKMRNIQIIRAQIANIQADKELSPIQRHDEIKDKIPDLLEAAQEFIDDLKADGYYEAVKHYKSNKKDREPKS